MDIQGAYNEWSHTYDSDENLTRDLDYKVTQDSLASLHFETSLEIGCGTGKNTYFLAQISETLHAVDFSEGMLEKARAKVLAQNVQFTQMDISQRWNFEDRSFDLIVCNLVLEHIQDLAFVFSEAARTLQPKGRFFINELHPFRQYGGSRARFHRAEEKIEVAAFIHHISDFLNAASAQGLRLVRLAEYWHEADSGKPPRLVSFLFEKDR